MIVTWFIAFTTITFNLRPPQATWTVRVGCASLPPWGLTQAQQCRSSTALLLQTSQSCFGHGAKGVRRVKKGLSPSPINVKESCVGEGSPYQTVTSPRAPPPPLSSQFSCAVFILVCFSFDLFHRRF